jgi:release factor glutamine methyltransferase
MLPTPTTSHVAFERVYEPAEDSYLLLDTLSSDGEKTFLQDRFGLASKQPVNSEYRRAMPSPIIAEIGTGSGVVLAFVNAHAEIILGRSDVLTFGIDVNRHACLATQKTVRIAVQDQSRQFKSHGQYLDNVVGDLTMPLRLGSVDVLIFNPPYVPTSELPSLPWIAHATQTSQASSFEDDANLLSLSYAGGADGMETTNRLLDLLPRILSAQGVSYILLCAQNKPEVVKEQIRAWGTDWHVETVGSSGKKAGWERLQIIRIWRSVPLPESAAF